MGYSVVLWPHIEGTGVSAPVRVLTTFDSLEAHPECWLALEAVQCCGAVGLTAQPTLVHREGPSYGAVGASGSGTMIVTV